MANTSEQYDEVGKACRQLFIQKMKDYGPAWRILRLPSLTDQIFIKAQRIRSIEDKGAQLVSDDIRGEFVGILNYSLIALIQLQLGVADKMDISDDEATQKYDQLLKEAKNLMERKNHDYGEAWRDMRKSSFTDLILQKLLRIKQIENNSGKTLVSEGLDANYFDMINYAVFALIQMNEKEQV